MSLTTDPTDPRIRRGAPDEAPVPQNEAYLVLSSAELANGYLQPYRDAYRHTVCNATTTMDSTIAATYARDPWFYGSTYCTTCRKHRPLDEFTWLDGSPMSPAQWSSEQLAAVVRRRQELSRMLDPEYQRIIANARRLRAEIDQIFTDVASWNDNSKARKDGCEPIDPDPDGKLRKLADGIDEMLARERARGRIS